MSSGASDQAFHGWSATRRALERYVAGRLEADSVVAAVTDAYYRKTGKGKGETLRPVIDVIERAAPGVVELAGSPDGPGFEVRVLGRSFPKQYEADLRSAAAAVLAGEGGREPGPATGTRHAALIGGRLDAAFNLILSRLVTKIRISFCCWTR